MVKFIRKLFNRRLLNMVNAVEEIQRKGTRIVSFDYEGERRNVLIGANCVRDIEGDAVNLGHWERIEARDIPLFKNVLLMGLENNKGIPRPVQVYNMRKIKNPCPTLRGA